MPTNAQCLPTLMLVASRNSSRLPLPDLVAAALAGGVDTIQLREKDLSRVELAASARRLNSVVGTGGTLVINGDIEVAAELGLGVHLPERGQTVSAARRRLSNDVLVGRSVHSPDAARSSDDADYLVAGHVFATSSKPGEQPIGLDGLRRIIAATDRPVLAIGGIDVDNVGEAIAAGAAGIAVISAIAGSKSPEQAARTLRDALAQARGQRMQTDQQIHVVVNGKDVDLQSGSTIADFLAAKGLAERLVVVELNGTIVPRQAFASTALADGDRAEVVHFVGGG